MSKRRDFLKMAGLTGVAIAQGSFGSSVLKASTNIKKMNSSNPNLPGMDSIDNNELPDDTSLTVIGAYGAWANSLRGKELPSLSFRRPEFTNIDSWRKTARQRLVERLGIIPASPLPKLTVHKKYEYDDLQVEEVSWQLPYGRPTEAIILKPAKSTGKLPGIVALHDHAGNKYFGRHKITRISDDQHPMMKDHQQHYYSGTAWANDVARQGYVVMIPDAFAFGSRRVMVEEVPAKVRENLKDPEPTDIEGIKAYNTWASTHESVLAKSLFCAGTSWPAVFFSEDKVALDLLAARTDVDAEKLGCCGLSGGGLRTTFLSGLDPRIKCAVNVGFTTTWADFLLNKSFTHTWMTYVPVLPNELEFPEIMGLRAPLPTLVLNDSEDQLYTMSEMQEAEKILTAVYKKAGKSENFKCSYYPGLHKFDKDMQTEAFKWFGRWLKSEKKA